MSNIVVFNIETGKSETIPANDPRAAAFRANSPASNPSDGFIPLSLMRQRIEALGMLEAFATYLAQNPAEQMKLLTLEGGRVDPNYPGIAEAFDLMAVPEAARAIILAPESAGLGVP